jgi:hypothetical protein
MRFALLSTSYCSDQPEDLPLQLIIPVMGVYPAAGQRFTGKKGQIGFFEGSRILRFLAMLVAANQFVAEGVKQVLQCQHFNKVIIALVFQKHGDLL